jgi:hypothetical protein
MKVSCGGYVQHGPSDAGAALETVGRTARPLVRSRITSSGSSDGSTGRESVQPAEVRPPVRTTSTRHGSLEGPGLWREGERRRRPSNAPLEGPAASPLAGVTRQGQ